MCVLAFYLGLECSTPKAVSLGLSSYQAGDTAGQWHREPYLISLTLETHPELRRGISLAQHYLWNYLEGRKEENIKKCHVNRLLSYYSIK